MNAQQVGGSNGTYGASTQRGAQSHTFSLSATGSAGLLESPLYYAAKWGAFEDQPDSAGVEDDTPDQNEEWDIRDTSGNLQINADGTMGDGIPDTFFFVSNPAALEDALIAVFNQIIERVSSGTAAAVVANDQEGTGAIYQALYDPVKRDNVTGERNEVRWIGTLHSLWVDPLGFIREDGDEDGRLDNYAVDPVIDIFFDDTAEPPRSRIRRYDVDASAGDEPPNIASITPDVVELEELRTIWNARERLSALTDAQVATNRTYTDGGTPGRHILTWLDGDLDGIVDTGENPTV